MPLISASALCRNTDNDQAMETHLFYLDEDSILREHVFRDNDDIGFNGSLNARNLTPAPDTRLASYWPFVAYQNSDNTFSSVRFNCTTSGINCWSDENLQVASSGPSSPLGMVPTGRNMNGVFLYYQREDGELVHSIWENDTDTWSSSMSSLLHAYATTNINVPGEPPLAFPRGQPISVFANPRGTNSTYLNFHALYQEINDRDISWLWKEGGQWKTAVKPEPLKNAMNKTSIACLTQESWVNKKLGLDRDMYRCYFFGSTGRLRSVHRDDSKWTGLGEVRGVGVQSP
jgi:hypothetical protein